MHMRWLRLIRHTNLCSTIETITSEEKRPVKALNMLGQEGIKQNKARRKYLHPKPTNPADSTCSYIYVEVSLTYSVATMTFNKCKSTLSVHVRVQ